jgi:hypothetical protein
MILDLAEKNYENLVEAMKEYFNNCCWRGRSSNSNEAIRFSHEGFRIW